MNRYLKALIILLFPFIFVGGGFTLAIMFPVIFLYTSVIIIFTIIYLTILSNLS